MATLKAGVVVTTVDGQSFVLLADTEVMPIAQDVPALKSAWELMVEEANALYNYSVEVDAIWQANGAPYGPGVSGLINECRSDPSCDLDVFRKALDEGWSGTREDSRRFETNTLVKYERYG